MTDTRCLSIPYVGKMTLPDVPFPVPDILVEAISHAPSMIYIRDCITGIISHPSLHKYDDYRLKNLSHSHKVCEICDFYTIDCIQHLLMECPGVQNERAQLNNYTKTFPKSVKSLKKGLIRYPPCLSMQFEVLFFCCFEANVDFVLDE